MKDNLHMITAVLLIIVAILIMGIILGLQLDMRKDIEGLRSDIQELPGMTFEYFDNKVDLIPE